MVELLGRPAKTVVDVGAYDGRHSRQLRMMWPTAELYLIDPWQPMSMHRTYEIDNSADKWLKVERACRARFATDSHAHIMKNTSEGAAKHFADKSVDVVFLDAGREYSLLMTYFSQWLPKLAPGGVLAGKGLAGKMRGDVWMALKDRFGKWERPSRTIWAVKWQP